jgi:hypothetical protein
MFLLTARIHIANFLMEKLVNGEEIKVQKEEVKAGASYA